ncbi:MAG TPA: pitrilysin family protein [Chthonomonadaceae bacterium]|nr:pitrilysin family protein [Chthonomonadaceae bacterium]
MLAATAALGAQAQQKLDVSRLQLKNGLTILALEDHTVPTVAYYTVFKVGSRNERPGITGLSHLFEHMMFNGSAKYKPKVFDQEIEAGGGSSNAFTTSDSTEYNEEFSSGTLDIVLRMEADRMRALKLDRANIEQERGIVSEERRVNFDNSVEGSMTERLWNSAFVAHPYRWDTIGFMKDIQAIRLADAKAYFKTFYAPNNAVVAVVGDFHTADLFKRMAQYFSDIPRGPAPPPVVNAEPPQLGERRIEYHRPAELPAVRIGYKSISFKDPLDPALDVLSAILATGESSRLYHSLVYEKQIAASVSASNESRIDPGLFTFAAQAQGTHTAADCEQAIYAVLDDIKLKGVTEREVQKAKNGLRFGVISGYKTNEGRAGLLAENDAFWGDWKHIYTILPKYDRVTAAEVQQAARKIFNPLNRTVVTLVPEKEPQ